MIYFIIYYVISVIVCNLLYAFLNEELPLEFLLVSLFCSLISPMFIWIILMQYAVEHKTMVYRK